MGERECKENIRSSITKESKTPEILKLFSVWDLQQYPFVAILDRLYSYWTPNPPRSRWYDGSGTICP